MTIETLVVDRIDCPLDLLLFRKLQREVPGLVEDTLRRNPGLAAKGPILPLGMKVVVDLPAPPSQVQTRPVITLWT